MHIEGMPVYVDPSHGEWLERTIRTTATIGFSKADRPNLFRYQLGIEEAVVRTTGEFAVSDRTFYIEYERKLYRWTAEDRKWHDTGMQDAPVFADFYATDGFQFTVSGESCLSWKKQRHPLPIVGWWRYLERRYLEFPLPA